MAKREQFSAYIECPECSKNGHAEWEENENPVHGEGLARKLIAVPPGFHRGTQKDSAGDLQIFCDSCNVPVKD